MENNLNSIKIAQLANYLDTDQFEKVRELIASDCVYFSSSDKLIGPDKIINSYREHTEYAHGTFDKVIYESVIQKMTSAEFAVLYKDIISKNGKTHEYTCKQIISFNSENLISTIKHEELPGEYEKLKDFYNEIGL